jgi:acetyl-CoA acetyltransferase
VVLAWAKDLKPDMATVNPNGGGLGTGTLLRRG